MGSSCILIVQRCTEHQVYTAQTMEQYYKESLAEIRPLVIWANVPMASDHAGRSWPTGHIRSGPTHGKVRNGLIRKGCMYVQLAADCSPRPGLATPPRKVTGDMCGRAFYCFCASWPVSLRPIPGGFGQAGRHGRGLYKVLVGPLPSTLSSGRTQVHERLVGK